VQTTSVFVTHDQVEAMTLGDRIVVMKDGIVQQVGTPLELYRKPVNRFVAGFIGSPSMNFITLDVTAADGRFSLTGQDFSFSVPANLAPSLGARVGGPVSMGMRPQHIRLGKPPGDHQIGFAGTLLVTEQLGDEQLLAVRVGRSEIRIAGVDPDLALAAGTRIDAVIAAENLHFFDAA
jgi:multiple sugar transport system ATP-binding protein